MISGFPGLDTRDFYGFAEHNFPNRSGELLISFKNIISWRFTPG